MGFTDIFGAFTELAGRDYNDVDHLDWGLVPGPQVQLPFTFRMESGTLADKIQVRVQGDSTGSQDQICVADVCVQEGRVPGPSIRRDCCPRPSLPCHPDMAVEVLGKIPAAFPDQPATVLSPVATPFGAFNTERFKPGQVTGTSGSVVVPEDLKHETWGITLDVNYIAPTSIFEPPPDLRLQLDYVTLGLGDSPLPASRTGTLTDTVSATLTHAIKRSLFFIPYSDLVGKEKGKVPFAFYRRGDLESGTLDDGNMYLISVNAFFGPRVLDPVVAF